MSARAKLIVQFESYEQASADFGPVEKKIKTLVEQEWLEGTTDTTIDTLWSDQRSISAADDLDLAGVLTNISGNAVTFVEVAFIIIHNRSTSASLAIGGDGSAAFVDWVGNASDIVNLGPGGIFVISTRLNTYTPDATTADILQIAPSAGTVIYDIHIGGRSA